MKTTLSKVSVLILVFLITSFTFNVFALEGTDENTGFSVKVDKFRTPPQNTITIKVDEMSFSFHSSSIRELKRELAKFDFSSLSYAQRLEIYDAAAISGVGPFFANFLIGFGFGSTSQGDRGGNIVGGLFDAIIWGTVLTVALIPAALWLTLGVFVAWQIPLADVYADLLAPFVIVLIPAGGLLVLSHLGQGVRALTYAGSYNKALRTALGLGKKQEDRFALAGGPVPIVSKSGDISLGAHLAIKFKLN